ncbi:hypothetical protein ACW0JT_24315 [Arthrobacter sp. SA17]
MIEILQWSTLAVCSALALARIPSALRGLNRSLFGIFVLATVAILLSIREPYLAVDSWLGSENYTNLILRFIIYVTVFLAGRGVAKAFNDSRALRRLTGPVGAGVLGLIMLTTVVLFLLADTTGSSTGLVALPNKSPENSLLIELYAAAGRLYPAYVAACLLPATLKAVGQSLPGAVRFGAALLSLGFLALILGMLFPIIPASLGFLQWIINYTAVLALMAGLTSIWIGRVLMRRAKPSLRSFTKSNERVFHKIIRT